VLRSGVHMKRQVEQSVGVLKQSKVFFLGMLVFDLLFFVAIAVLQFSFLAPATRKVVEITRTMQETVGQPQLADVSALLSPQVMAGYREVLVLIVEFLIFVLFAWIASKLFAWFFSHRSFHTDVPFGAYAKKFALLSVFWFVVLIACLFVAAAAGGVVVFVSLALIAAYFSQVHFALIPAQHTFKKGFRQGVVDWKRLVPVFAINTGLLVGAIVLAAWSANISPVAGSVLFLALILPTLAFCRFHMVVAAWKGSSRKR